MNDSEQPASAGTDGEVRDSTHIGSSILGDRYRAPLSPDSNGEKVQSLKTGKWWRPLKYLVSASFISLVLGFIALYYTLYGSRTHMSMDIAAESNVLDIKHPIGDLAILFQGRDIEEDKSNLKVLTIRVINDGEANIRESDFDSRLPFGLQIDGGRIVRAQVAGSNSSYLADNVNPRVDGQNRILLDKVIFDKGKFIGIEVLVLHPKNASPTIKPLGKIAGVDEITVTNSFQQQEQASLLRQVFNGPAAVQILRTISYALIALMTIVAMGFVIGGLVTARTRMKKRKRRNVVASLPQPASSEAASKRKILETIFVENGISVLLNLQRFAADPDALKRAMATHKEVYGGSVALDFTADEARALQYQMLVPGGLTRLISAKVAHFEGDELKFDPEFASLLDRFITQTND